MTGKLRKYLQWKWDCVNANLSNTAFSSLLDTIEEFDGERWVMRSDKLEMKRYAYGMPSFMPESVVRCNN